MVPRDRDGLPSDLQAHASFVACPETCDGSASPSVTSGMRCRRFSSSRTDAGRRSRDIGHGPRALLFQISLRVAADARRHHRRHPIDPDGGAAEERQSIEPPQAEAIAQRRRRSELLDRALATIDIERRAGLPFSTRSSR